MFLALLALAPFLAAAQDDRARIVDGVESWYQVVQDGKNRGYAREKLERVKDEWKYEYHHDFILDVPDAKDPARTVDYSEYWDVTATLDEAFQPTALKAVLEAGGVTVEYSIAADDEKRTLTTSKGPSPLADDVHAFPNLLLYSLRQEGRMAKAGRQSAKVLAPRGDLLVEAALTLEVADPTVTQGVRRTGTTNPVRFLKPLPAPRPEAERLSARVDKYGRIVELSLRQATFVLVEGDLEAFRNAVTMHRSTRREIFSKAEAMRAASTPPPEEPRTPRVTADNLLSALRDAEKAVEALQALKGGDEEDLRKAYLQALDLWKPVRDRALSIDHREALRRAAELRDAAEAAWDGSARALTDARRSYVRLIQAADRVDPGAVDRELRSLRDQQKRFEFVARPEEAELSRWIALAEPLSLRTRTRAELARRELLVSGTVISQTEEALTIEVAAGVTQRVRFVRDASTAVLNGAACRVGDTIDGLRIEKIQTHSVTVSLRGELREVPLNSK